MNRKHIVGIAGLVFCILLVLVVTSIPVQAQCAMCRASVENSTGEGQDTIANGLNKGILYLMAVPYVIIGCIGFFWYRYSKKK